MSTPEDTRFHPVGPETDSEGFLLDTETVEQTNQAQNASVQVQGRVETITDEEKYALQAEVVALSPGAMPDEKGSNPRDGSYEI
jgi:hypothetical protein